MPMSRKQDGLIPTHAITEPLAVVVSGLIYRIRRNGGGLPRQENGRQEMLEATLQGAHNKKGRGSPAISLNLFAKVARIQNKTAKFNILVSGQWFVQLTGINVPQLLAIYTNSNFEIAGECAWNYC